jgi:hypothetical protein
MRSSVARRRNGAFIADTAIALVVVGSVTFFIIVMEFFIGQGELTKSELLLLGTNVRIAHSTTSKLPNK